MSLISVIVPCYNCALFVKDTIQSILAQTYNNFELILVNDGSTDDTAQIIQSFQDKRIRYIFQPNKGQSAACNQGLLIAKGDYIKFFDADDIMNREHLAELMKTVQNRTDVIVSCAWGRFYNTDPFSATFKDSFLTGDVTPLTWLRHAMSQKYDMMPAWLWLIPRNILEQAGAWDERLSLNNDFEFSIRILLNAISVRFSEKAKVYYRSNVPSSLSSNLSFIAYESAYLSAKLGCSYLLAADSSSNMKRLCANKYLFWMYAVYPTYPDLVKKLELEIRELGGGDRKIGGSSKLMHFLQACFGWKAAKRVWLFARKIGYVKWGQPIKKEITILFFKLKKRKRSYAV